MDGARISCRCRHGIHEPSRLHRQRFAAWVLVSERAAATHADTVRAEERRERGRQARRRWTAEENGDPRG